MNDKHLDIHIDVESPIEHEAYLISRGVRPMSLIGSCDLDDDSIKRAWGILSQTSIQHDVIPFVVCSKERAQFGFAASGWVVTLYEWLIQTDDVPTEIKNSILGLLLGYSTESIAKYLDRAKVIKI